jgi:hypothetical protein
MREKKGSSDQVTKITRSVWHIYELDTMQILALFQSFNSYQNKLNYQRAEVTSSYLTDITGVKLN